MRDTKPLPRAKTTWVNRMIVAGRRSVTADTALRLARALGTTADFWMNLQKTYDLRTVETALGSALKDIKPLPCAKSS